MKNRVLTYSGLIIAGLVVTGAFLTATSYTQLAVAVLLYPMLVYSAFKAFPRKVQIYPSNTPVTVAIPSLVKTVENVEPVKEKTMIGITDIDKRVFLKLIGGAGLTLFLFSLFNKRAEGLFFKNLPAPEASGSVSLQDTSGKKIDPAQHQVTDGYQISEIDDSIIAFYGFTHNGGAWYIMKVESDAGSIRYVKGESGFPNNWNSRENLKYDYYNNIF